MTTDTLKLERIGGLGGFGGPHLKSRGECLIAELSATDQAAVEALFATARTARRDRGGSPLRDGFCYLISRQTRNGAETVEVPESRVPAALLASIKDTLE